MTIIDIIILVSVIAIIAIITGIYIYKKVHHMPTGECSCCSTKNGMKRMIKKAKKELAKEEKCCCNEK